LTDRSGLPRRRPLLRVVLDTSLRLSLTSRLVKTANQDLLVFTSASLKSPKARKLQKAGVELTPAKSRAGKIDLPMVLQELGKRDILSVLLEAGPRLNGSALATGIAHKLILFYAPKLAGHSSLPFMLASNPVFPRFHIQSVRQFGRDVAIQLALK